MALIKNLEFVPIPVSLVADTLKDLHFLIKNENDDKKIQIATDLYLSQAFKTLTIRNVFTSAADIICCVFTDAYWNNGTDIIDVTTAGGVMMFTVKAGISTSFSVKKIQRLRMISTGTFDLEIILNKDKVL